MKKLLVFIFFLLLSYSGINAQVWTPPGVQSRPTSDTFLLDFGMNKYDGDTYAYIAPGLNMNFDGKWGFSFQVPLNILAVDANPKQQGTKPGQIRSIDYDTKSDYQRVLNYFWYGNFGEYNPKKMTYSLFVGKMYDGHIGHGTIINRYINNQRVDIYKLGVMADVNTYAGGIQVFTNSIWDKEVNAGRAYVRPYGLIVKTLDFFSGKDKIAMLAGNVADEAGRKKVYEEINAGKEEEKYIEVETDPVTGEKREVEKTAVVKSKKERTAPEEEKDEDVIWNRFAIGYTYAYDGKAPTALELDTTGNIKFDKDNNAKLKSTKRIGVEGYDAEFKILSMSYLELTPYVDFNRIRKVENAWGRHYGVNARIGGRDIYLVVKPELRKMSSTYIPIYFDSYYEIERYQSNLESTYPYTKYEYIHTKTPNDPEVKGYYHTIIFNMYKIALEANYEDYTGKDNSRVFVGLYVPVGTMFRVSAFYSKKGFDKSKEAFKVDERSMGAAELSIKIGPVALSLQNRRRWVLDSATNQFKAVDEQMFLVNAGKSF